MSEGEVEDIDLQKKSSESEEEEEEEQKNSQEEEKEEEKKVSEEEDNPPEVVQQQDEEENEDKKKEAAEQFFKEQQQQHKEIKKEQPAIIKENYEEQKEQKLERAVTLSTISPEAAAEAIKIKEELHSKLKVWFDKVQLYAQQHKDVFDQMWVHLKNVCQASIEETGNLMKVLRARGDIEKKHIEAAMQLSKNWKILVDKQLLGQTESLNNAISLLQTMNESALGKERNLSMMLDEEAKRIEGELKKIDTFFREMQITIKKASINNKKFALKKTETWKQWSSKLFEMVKVMKAGKRFKTELYGGLCLIVEAVEAHCQSQRELAASICSAWVGVNNLETQRIGIMKEVIKNVKDGFKQVFLIESENLEQAIEEIVPDESLKIKMDITKALTEKSKETISKQQGGEISMELTAEIVFKFLEISWDEGWEETASQLVQGRFIAKMIIIGKTKEILCNILITIENYLVAIEVNKQKPDCIFRLEMAKCRMGEQNKAVELIEVSTGIFSFPQKLILRFEEEEEAKKLYDLISGCVQKM